MNDNHEFFKNMLTWGTRECGLMCGVIGVIVGILMLTIGFWKVLLVCAFALIGMFIGGTKNKMAFVKHIVGKLVPENKDPLE